MFNSVNSSETYRDLHLLELMDEGASSDILNRITDGFFTLNSKWEVTSVNPVAESMINLPRHLIVGRRADEVFHSKERAKFTTRYRRVMKEKKPTSFEESYDENIFKVSAYPKNDGGMAVFYRDITRERKREADLKRALEMRNEFISIASHELKTPMAALMLQMEMIQRNIAKSESLPMDKIKKVVDNSHRDLLRLNRLVEDMLDVSRIANGKLSMQFDFFNLDEFMEELVDRMSPALPNFKRRVKFDFNSPVIVHWDRFRIEQVVMNLLTNAYRYGEDQPIILETSMASNMATITVQDKGMGIAEQNLSRIFERFERASNYREHSGLGLGLYISNEIVKQHKGTIKLQSALGKGSTFTVEIPYSQS